MSEVVPHGAFASGHDFIMERSGFVYGRLPKSVTSDIFEGSGAALKGIA
ncbi:MAG: hypothetical protein HUU21_30435 [Polyangiaceae bacterium]|nr:hypothetical protein [Polyangiaceae bacterium]NUQ77876.1 hypothetical protein [Polyangiaceae bacterium]